MVPSPDGDDDVDVDEEWEWVQRPPHHSQDPPREGDDDGDGFFSGADEGTAGTSTPTWAGMLCLNRTQSSESLSSTASSPILKHNLAVTVMAKEHISALDALHHSSGSEWIEPQLVFSKPLGLHFEGFEIYKVVTYLQDLPKAKEALASLLSDPVVSDAVMSNKAFQELVHTYGDSNQISERPDLNSECTSSLFYERGKKAYELLKQKLTTAVDILLSLLGRQTFEKSVVDQLDATVKSCILLVAMLVFRVVGKRSEGMYLAHTV